MEQQGYATGADQGPGGGAGGRTGGAGQLTADARFGVSGQAEALARRLAEAEPATAHRLFTAAFGLYGARHFGGPAAPAAPSTSWWHGPTVQLGLGRRSARGLRRARRGVPAQLPRGASAVTAGRHRKPERSRASAVPEAAAERRIAARLLLAHPLVTAAGPHGEGFPLIQRHADWLAERFQELLGYPLAIGEGYARLHKAALPDRGLAGFTPSGYAGLLRTLDALADGRSMPEPAAPEIAQVLTDWQVVRPAGEPAQELARALAPLPALPAPGPELTVRRLLAETPVVLYDELAEPERRWLTRHQSETVETFAEFLGLEAELRAEGVALLDPAGELTDLVLPGTDPVGQAALLLVEQLVEELRPLPEPGVPPAVLVPDALIDGALGDIADEYGLPGGWCRDRLADRPAFRRDALELLHRLGLIAPAGRAWVLRAPAARYAAEAELEPPPGTGRHSRPLLQAH